ncbi:MAG: hypothetical protein ACRD6W_11180 [Nitrososphaerales archaeon]
MSSLEDAVDDVKKSVSSVRDDVQKSVDAAAEVIGSVRRRPLRRLASEKAEERLGDRPFVGQRILGGGGLVRRRRRANQG